MKIIIKGPEIAPLYFETNKESVILGRSPHCDLVIASDSVSREHCCIEFRNGDVYVTDISSHNGIYINQQKIAPKTPTRYQTVLPFKISNLFSVEITLEVEEEIVVHKPEILTRTTMRVPHASKNKTIKPPRPEMKMKFAAIISTLIMGGAIYFSMTKEPVKGPVKSIVTDFEQSYH